MKTQRLEARVIDACVPRACVGVYSLYDHKDDQLAITYVGRSDTDLARRLHQHARAGAADRFTFQVTRSRRSAFYLEARDWHRYHGLLNRIHPRAPKRLPYTCPYCEAARQMASDLGRIAAA